MDICQRIRSVQCWLIDDQPYYRMREVLDALGLPTNRSTRERASSLIDPACKRYMWQKKVTKTGKVYSDKRFCYINRKGVERLIIRYGGTVPRSKLLEALPTS